MRVNVADRAYLRKSVKILVPQMKKSKIVKHFEKEEIAQRIIYDTINRLQKEGSILLENCSNDRKGVSQRRLGRKFDLNQSVISRKKI